MRSSRRGPQKKKKKGKEETPRDLLDRIKEETAQEVRSEADELPMNYVGNCGEFMLIQKGGYASKETTFCTIATPSKTRATIVHHPFWYFVHPYL